MPTLSEYKNFVKKYNKEFSLVGISKLNKSQLKKKIEDVLSEQRTEIKDEWRKLHPNEYGQKEAPKKTAPKKTAPKKTAPKKETPKKTAPKKEAPKKETSKKNEYDIMFAYMTGMANKSVKFTEKQLETALKNIDKHLTGGQKLEWKRVYNDKKRIGVKPQEDRKKVIEAIEPKTDLEKTLKKKLQEREKTIEPKTKPKSNRITFNPVIVMEKRKLSSEMFKFMSGIKGAKKFTKNQLTDMYNNIDELFLEKGKENFWKSKYNSYIKNNI